MFQKAHILRYVLLVNVMVVGYIFVTSLYIGYKSDKKIYEVAQDFVLERAKVYFEDKGKVVDREIKLSLSPDIKLAETMKGKILLQVESAGEAWYVDPYSLKRQYLGLPQKIDKSLEKFVIAISSNELQRYLGDESVFPDEFLGKIVRGDSKEIAYYVSPADKKGYGFSDYKEAMEMIEKVGEGITNENIRKIEVAPASKLKYLDY